MPKFNVEVEHDGKALKFFTETKERLKSPNMANNPFTGSLDYDQGEAVVNLSTIYPNVAILAVFPLVPVFLLGLSFWWLLFSIPFLAVGFAHTKYALYLGMRVGLRKAGYKGKIKMRRYKCSEKKKEI